MNDELRKMAADLYATLAMLQQHPDVDVREGAQKVVTAFGTIADVGREVALTGERLESMLQKAVNVVFNEEKDDGKTA